jgi:CDP-diacylglycerol--serine O-phosphatidyltransferase
VAIVFAFKGNLAWSACLVGIACVFDFIDGFSARLLKAHSEIGKQLDSLADMVSFGVVPGVMMFLLLYQVLNGCNEYFPHYRFIASSTGFLITVFSAVRLAKFNIDTRQTNSFIGVPTPANTIFISSLPLILKFGAVSESIMHYILHPYFLISLSVISSFLLVAPLPLFALKFKNFSWVENKVRYIFLVLALMLLILFQFIGIPLIIILYIILSIINNIATKKSV